MARKRRPKIEEKDLHGFTHFKLLTPLLERLNDNACKRDKAGNRKLHCVFADRVVDRPKAVAAHV